MSNQWVIGCTHFDDPTVIPFRKNRFKTLEDMQEKICSSWNAKVDDNDPVSMRYVRTQHQERGVGTFRE